ncbi:hypothetical protein COB55_00720 [Candidatus Wolfebacteria bacterium]|nr:MAG: hypothetical protein COB55_00720 [Candidatus Wolfebacteria bacterium]
MSNEVRTIQLRSGTLAEYEIRKSKRAKRSSLTLYPDGRLVATIPWFRTVLAATRLVQQQRDWIDRQLQKIVAKPAITLQAITKHNRKFYVEEARVLLEERVMYFSKSHDFYYGDINIKVMKSQWGSCSTKKNLNFNLKLVFLPRDLVDYIVVHELCHLKEMNHGKKFWDLVESILPDYEEREERLSKYVMR